MSNRDLRFITLLVYGYMGVFLNAERDLPCVGFIITLVELNNEIRTSLPEHRYETKITHKCLICSILSQKIFRFTKQLLPLSTLFGVIISNCYDLL